ncbi:MAG: CoA transferase [Chloroflexi bacterium]|nr:CoA transferase [Chloroflexota bacterium]
MTSRALAGVRVIDLAEVWAGPFGASLLGDMGADVIKVESFPRRSLTRPLQPDARVAEGPGPVYERVDSQIQGNRNKRNVAIDIRSEGGAEAFRRLLGSADVLIEGFAAGAIDRAGFGWGTVHALNPRLSMISMPAWGVRGPYSGYVALGSGIDASVGHVSVRGAPGGPIEDVAGGFHTDATSPIEVVFASMAALRRRESTGEGSFIDFSQAEGFAWALAGSLGEWELTGRVPQPLGNRDPHVVPHGCYPTAVPDQWVTIAAETDAQWAGLALTLGHPEWAEDGHPWASVAGRLGAREQIDGQITAFTRARGHADAAETLQAAGVIAAPVAEPSAMLASAQLQTRGWFHPVDQPYLGTRLFPGFLWQMEPDGPEYERRSRLIGEDNVEVLAELGYSAEEIRALEAAHAIGDHYDAETDALLGA